MRKSCNTQKFCHGAPCRGEVVHELTSLSHCAQDDGFSGGLMQLVATETLTSGPLIADGLRAYYLASSFNVNKEDQQQQQPQLMHRVRICDELLHHSPTTAVY